jgi:hypothetical protein
VFNDKTYEIYSSRDKIRTELIDYAQQYLDIEGIDFSKTSYLSYLINVLSVMSSNLIYYNTATYREFFLTRAQQKESVLNLSAMIGYTPEKAIPATADLLITFPIKLPSTAHVTIPGRHDAENNPHKFYAGSIPFSNENEIKVDVIIDRGRVLSCKVLEINKKTSSVRNLNWRFTENREAINFVITATQIEEKKDDFYFPKLKPYEFYDRFIAFDGDFADISLSTVMGEEDKVFWSDKTSLFMMTPGEYAYSYRVNSKGVTIYFGNGIVGTQPPEEAKCEISVSTTNGYKGNVISGSIVASEPLYIDVETPNGRTIKQSLKLSCINTSPASGGKNFPGIDEIRTNAIAQVSTNGRLVTEHDFNNAKSFITNLPIQNSIPILKRSDLKRNEIVLFTDLIYQENYVPTRNSTVILNTDDIIYNVEYYNIPEYILIRSGDPVNILPGKYENEDDIDQIEYVSMFDILINTTDTTTTYFYILDYIEKPLVLKEYFLENQSRTITIPNRAVFNIEKYDPYDTTQEIITDMITVKFYFQKVLDSDMYYSELNCDVEISESLTIPMVYNESENEYWFEMTTDLNNIPEGDIYFDFQLKGVPISSSIPEKIFNCQTNVVIKQNMSDKINSFVTKLELDNNIGTLRNVPSNKNDRIEYLQNIINTLENTDSEIESYDFDSTDSTGGVEWGHIYDVPLIRKDYLDYLKQEGVYDNYIELVIHKVATLNMSQYKILTDDVNIKFSNTTGTLTNMNFNVVNKGYIDLVNPEYIPENVLPGYNVCVTDNKNPWNVEPYNKNVGGFVATKLATGGWSFMNIQTNDIFWRDETNGPGRRNTNSNYKVIYNGENIYTLNKKIPLEVEAIVWYGSDANISEQGLINNIKQALIENFLPKLGYDKNVYISEIFNIIHGVRGVRHCNVLKPEHDIFFNYELDELSHEELMQFSPQLVYLTYGNINIKLRKSS